MIFRQPAHDRPGRSMPAPTGVSAPISDRRPHGRGFRTTIRIGLIAALLVPLLSGSLGAPPVATGDDLSKRARPAEGARSPDRRPET